MTEAEDNIVTYDGSLVAPGHPVGMTGARLAGRLLIAVGLFAIL